MCMQLHETFIVTVQEDEILERAVTNCISVNSKHTIYWKRELRALKSKKGSGKILAIPSYIAVPLSDHGGLLYFLLYSFQVWTAVNLLVKEKRFICISEIRL